MNQRIKLLAEQAVQETQLLMIMEYRNFESKMYEKFAGLIVQECAKWVNENVGMITPEAKHDLYKHFGVEE